MLTDAELTELILALQGSTPLARINLAEGRAVFAKLAELGYTLAKPVVR